ncbi:hypothetical protein BC835DRAFT_1389516 [Cytidiella melzeri]|nr:hypothetical protein BC835DRAFT_1389516 [Cytidiella melzeri]
MKYSNSLLLLAALNTSAFYTVMVSATLYGSRGLELRYPLSSENIKILKRGEYTGLHSPIATVEGFKADHKESQYYLYDQSNAAHHDLKHWPRREAYIFDNSKATILHPRLILPESFAEDSDQRLNDLITELRAPEKAPREGTDLWRLYKAVMERDRRQGMIMRDSGTAVEEAELHEDHTVSPLPPHTPPAVPGSEA